LMKRYRIDGQVYVAASAEDAYSEHMRGWRDLGELQGPFVPAVPVFVEHPAREIGGLELGRILHEAVEYKTAGLTTGRTRSDRQNESNLPKASQDVDPQAALYAFLSGAEELPPQVREFISAVTKEGLVEVRKDADGSYSYHEAPEIPEEGVVEDLAGQDLPLLSTEREEQLIAALEASQEEVSKLKDELRTFHESWDDVWYMLTGEDNRSVLHGPGIRELWRRLAGDSFGVGVYHAKGDLALYRPTAETNPEALDEKKPE
jgi:hypothetical protein